MNEYDISCSPTARKFFEQLAEELLECEREHPYLTRQQCLDILNKDTLYIDLKLKPVWERIKSDIISFFGEINETNEGEFIRVCKKAYKKLEEDHET